jgi:peroxin-3
LSESGLARPRKSKAQLWNEIKISSITRSFTLLYTLSLLTLLTRIQLNLLGRLNYLSSVISLTRPGPPERANSISLEDNDSPGSPGGPTFGNDFETNRRYLAFTWFLLNKGYAEILSQVQAAVTGVFGTISPTEAISATRLSELTLEVRQKIEGSTANERRAKNWLAYLLPPGEEEEDLLIESGVLTPPSISPTSSPDRNPTSSTLKPSSSPPPAATKSGLSNPTSPLRKLLDETSDLIESPAFTRIHTLLLDNLFSHLIDTKVAEQAFPPPTLQQQPAETYLPTQRITEIPSAVTVIPGPESDAPKAKLATILAVLTRQAHAIGNGNRPPNEYVEVMEKGVRELEAFAAVVYSSQLDVGTGEEGSGKVVREGLAGGVLLRESQEEESGGAGGGKEGGEGVEGVFESAWSRVLGSSPAAGGGGGGRRR